LVSGVKADQSGVEAGVPGAVPARPVQSPVLYRIGVLEGFSVLVRRKSRAARHTPRRPSTFTDLSGVEPVSPACAPACPVQVRFRRAVRRLVQLSGRRRRLCTGWAQEFCFKRLFLPSDYKYPFTYLGEDKVAIQIISLPSLSLSPPLKSIQFLKDLPFYPLKSKFLW
jgi:hypothetical protein